MLNEIDGKGNVIVTKSFFGSFIEENAHWKTRLALRLPRIILCHHKKVVKYSKIYISQNYISRYKWDIHE